METATRTLKAGAEARQVSSGEVWLSAALHGRAMSLNVLRARGRVWVKGSRIQLGLCRKVPEASVPWTVYAGAKLSPGRTVSSTMLELEHCDSQAPASWLARGAQSCHQSGNGDPRGLDSQEQPAHSSSQKPGQQVWVFSRDRSTATGRK